MTLTVGMITTDTTDAEALARWWAEQTGAEVAETNEGWFVIVRGGTLPVWLAFQKVEEVTPGKNRLHLDLTASGGLDTEVERLLASGATLVERRGDEHFRWVTLADPQGNQFCVSGPHAPAPET
ncbi:VOC family protein [Ornithinimicrobium faecis]|uniref:VOC family protein n=1 Tax=Ornithinimicrobium faecis TaxID=2934158 RepID=A0ABY4YT87_9MICO|nr:MULTISPECIES: VOC family protein [unclassified Ornithinimicrobium]USQ79991.1 VOC family protein [Ornithinimicrobium sp. HY1793]